MTVKEYLTQGYYLDKRINSALREVTSLRRLALSISSPGFEEHYNPNRPKEAAFARILEKIWVQENAINDEIDRLIELKREISHTIDQLDDVTEQMVLRFRYVNFMKWDEVAEAMDLQTRQLFKIHRRALKKLKNWEVKDSKVQ